MGEDGKRLLIIAALVILAAIAWFGIDLLYAIPLAVAMALSVLTWNLAFLIGTALVMGARAVARKVRVIFERIFE